MRSKMNLDTIANLAIVGVCILIAVIGVKKFLVNDQHVATAGPRRGNVLQLAGVSWASSDRSVLLALNTRCHYCNDSSDFYRRLAPVAAAAHVPLFAIFPQPIDEARAHWISQNLPAAGVHFIQAPTGQLPISGTPTVILVDRKGVILRAWTGKQPISGEAEILHALQQQGG